MGLYPQLAVMMAPFQGVKNAPQLAAIGIFYWTFVFRDYYECLRGLIEAYLLLNGIEADNHQCKNVYICFKFKELELDWEFLETIRLKRNAINYRGQFLKYDDWKVLKLKFQLHINLLKKEIETKLNS